MYRTIPLCAGFLLIFGLSAGVAQAQETSPIPAQPPAPAPVADKEKIPDTTVAKLPEKYQSWIHHVGNATDSVVAVSVTTTDSNGNTATRTGSGFVLRCDGFVIVPDTLVPRGERRFSAEISFARMDGGELAEPFSPVGRPVFRNYKIPFLTMKVNDHHFPCLPVLHPANVHSDMPVLVTWAIPDADKPGRVKTFSRKAVVGAKIGKENRYELSLTDIDTKDAPLLVTGAVVTDEKGIAALGMITESPTTPSASDLTFTTFAHLDYICNEVGLRPTLDDIPGDKSPPKMPQGMLRVPGGPVRVPPGLMREFYAQVYKTDVVCTPSCLMDRLPVTVGDYRTFLRHLTAPRLPAEWDLDRPGELVQDIRIADLPVTGVFYDDAVFYAESQGKRLPTPVEWLEALQGVKSEWFKKRLAEAIDLSLTIANMYQKKLQYWMDQMNVLVQKKGTDKPAKVFVDTPVMREINRQQFFEQFKYFTLYPWPPGINSPVGMNPEDVSDCGIRHVLTNAPELTIKNYCRDFTGIAPKPFPAIADIYLSSIDTQVNATRTGSNEVILFTTGKVQMCFVDKNDPSQIDFGFGLLCAGIGPRHFESHALSFLGGQAPEFSSLDYVMDVVPRNNPGFRCAK